MWSLDTDIKNADFVLSQKQMCNELYSVIVAVLQQSLFLLMHDHQLANSTSQMPNCWMNHFVHSFIEFKTYYRIIGECLKLALANWTSKGDNRGNVLEIIVLYLYISYLVCIVIIKELLIYVFIPYFRKRMQSMY